MLRQILGFALLLFPLACGRDRPATSGDEGARAPAADAAVPATPATGADRDSLPVILFLGNSLTAGYGLTAEEAFPALVQARLDSAGYRYRAMNAGVSGETSAGGLRRVDWLLRQPVAVLVLELGANDMLRGQDLAETHKNLREIIDRTRARYPAADVLLAGMQAPPNLGATYAESFRRLYVDLARETNATLIPFLLEGVAGDPALNQADGVHPTARGQQILAENVWRVLEPVLQRREGRTPA